MRATQWILAAVGLLMCVSTSRADFIDFNSVPSSGNPILTTLTTGGYQFSSTHFHTIDSTFGSLVSNGTIYIAEEAGNLGGPITMSKVGGGVFSLNRFDGAKLFLSNTPGFPNADFINVVGNLFGGGTVSAQFALQTAVAFQTFLLPGTFVNLTSVTFSGSVIGGDAGGIALDNIEVNATTAVPVPSGVVLTGLGFMCITGAGLVRRRVSRVVA